MIDALKFGWLWARSNKKGSVMDILPYIIFVLLLGFLVLYLVVQKGGQSNILIDDVAGEAGKIIG